MKTKLRILIAQVIATMLLSAGFIQAAELIEENTLTSGNTQDVITEGVDFGIGPPCAKDIK